MSSSLQPYQRLAPFIQEHIYNHGWTELRPMQVEACRILFETDAHLLIMAGTASGKTEAAFLPVLTLLYEQPLQTVGALYISPIKALINDQFDRLTDLLKASEIPVWAWHGDVAQSKKQQVLNTPQGIVQLTPESLESLLVNKHSELVRLFGQLRFVIIDEIHAFIGSDRGAQILCQLTRLARLTQNQPRRIGLSATLGDPSLAETWLRSGTEQSVITPIVAAAPRTIHLALEHFYDPGLIVRAKGDRDETMFKPHERYLFQQSAARKCLIFANGRTETEAVVATLRQLAHATGAPDIYHVHHGSISASLRETAEAAMRDSTSPTVTAATVTFEMGIDLGQLDRVIQLEAPASVSSFLQRLGRSGRRGNPADLRFVCVEDAPAELGAGPEHLPWQLLQCIAILQLYLEEKWIEPIAPVQFPFSLLYQQTLSTLLAQGELSPASLAQQVLTLPPFGQITPDDFRQLLRHLIDIDQIQRTPEGTLMVGLTGERTVRSFKFYAVFPDTEEYSVWTEAIELGSIVSPPSVGDRFALAGRAWEAIEVDRRKKRVRVQPAPEAASLSWRGSGGVIHTRILQRMRQVLLEDTVYPYLQPGAKARLQQARTLARSLGLAHSHVIPLEDGYCAIVPWCGTVAFRTLERLLRLHVREALKTKGVSGRSPYFLMVNLGKCRVEQLHYELESLPDRRLQPEMLLTEDEAPALQKYDEFVPPDLRRRAFVADYLNLPELQAAIRCW